ncbi:MAG TPA: DUF1993 domain-containing protein [Polyangiaceae bacterium]|nr:DUF1993 domain-containing protein [Polyangiaceae bacterium]
MPLYEETVPQFSKVLQNLGRWLDKAEALAKAKGFDPDTLLTARLAPDQYPLLKQIQAACDAAKQPASRLAGKEPPVHPDTEKTWAEAKARIATCVAYLGTLTPADFEAAENRLITLPFLPGKGCRGGNYAREMALPNFYFHASMAYAILRHNGVDVGKIDFIGGMTLEDL